MYSAEVNTWSITDQKPIRVKLGIALTTANSLKTLYPLPYSHHCLNSIYQNNWTVRIKHQHHLLFHIHTASQNKNR